MPVRTGLALDRSLAIFPHVRGDAELVVGGATWLEETIPLPHTATSVQVTQRPVYIKPAAALTVVSLRPPELSADTRPCHDTRQRPASSAPTVVTLRKCSGADAQECTVVAGEQRVSGGDKASFAGLPFGTYEVDVRHPLLRPFVRRVTLTAAREHVVRAELTSVRVVGTVRRGSHPLRADLSFGTGDTTTDENGHYTAVLPSAPGRETVTVIRCGGEAPYDAIPDEGLADGSLFDIEIPDNRLDLTIRDAVTGAAIPEARAFAAVLLDKGGVERFSTDFPAADAIGTTSIREVQPNAWLHVCAHHPNYETKCADDLRVSATETRSLTLSLDRRAARAGKLRTSVPALGGRLYWVNAAGYVTESAPVGSDGSFTVAVPHDASEHVVLVSMNLPLSAIPLTPDTARTPEFVLPPFPVRQFAVLLHGSQPNARIALSVDGRFVPSAVFERFQTLGNQASRAENGASLPVRGVAAAQSLVVLAGPPSSFFPPDKPQNVDLSSMSQYRALFTAVPVTSASVDVTK